VLLIVFNVLEELKYKRYHSQMEKYLQIFHHRPTAAALYKKVVISLLIKALVYIYTCILTI